MSRRDDGLRRDIDRRRRRPRSGGRSARPAMSISIISLKRSRSRPSQTAGRSFGADLEAADAIENVIRPARLAVFAVIDDVDAGLDLLLHHVGDGARKRGVVIVPASPDRGCRARQAEVSGGSGCRHGSSGSDVRCAASAAPLSSRNCIARRCGADQRGSVRDRAQPCALRPPSRRPPARRTCATRPAAPPSTDRLRGWAWP